VARGGEDGVVKLAIPNFDPAERAGRLKAIAALLAVVSLPPAGLWVAGQYRYEQDRRWCQSGSVANPKELILDESCVAQRQDGRWGPFLAFGTSTRGKARD
jgi:hypothetical protein